MTITFMQRKIGLLVVILMLLTACASQLETGNAHYRNKHYDMAAASWNPLADAGNPYAQYNVALLWESGLGSTPLNLEQAAIWYLRSAKQQYVPAMVRLADIQTQLGYKEAALSWYNLAARWGNINASNRLKVLNQPVPSNDLQKAALARQKQEEAKKQQEIGDTIAGLLVIGSAVLGASTNNGSTYIPSTSTSSATKSQGKSSIGSSYLCPNGSYVDKGPCKICPDGSWIGAGGRCAIAPGGGYVRQTGTNSPVLTPKGTFVEGGRGTVTCPDGSFVAGSRCQIAPNGTFIGVD